MFWAPPLDSRHSYAATLVMNSIKRVKAIALFAANRQLKEELKRPAFRRLSEVFRRAPPGIIAKTYDFTDSKIQMY
jgi:hypothetical protein